MSSRTSSPRARISANHLRAIGRKSSGGEFSQMSMAGSRSTAPESLNIAFMTMVP
jgi:hypothetical protein